METRGMLPAPFDPSEIRGTHAISVPNICPANALEDAILRRLSSAATRLKPL